MTGVEDMNFGVRQISAIRLWFRGIKRKIVLAPKHQKPRLMFSHPCLPFRVRLHTGPVVVEQLGLNVDLSRLIEESKLVGPQVGP